MLPIPAHNQFCLNPQYRGLRRTDAFAACCVKGSTASGAYILATVQSHSLLMFLVWRLILHQPLELKPQICLLDYLGYKNILYIYYRAFFVDFRLQVAVLLPDFCMLDHSLQMAYTAC